MTTKKKPTPDTKEKENEQNPVEQTDKKEEVAPIPEAEEGKAEPETEETQNSEPETPDPMQVYFKAYPDCNVFYRTSDGQVFLEADHHLAVNHQRGLKGEFQTIKRK